MIKVKVDYSGMKAMAHDLAKYSPLPVSRILLLETGSVIKICALRAEIASIAQIKRDVAADASTYHSPDYSLVSENRYKSKGRVWFVSGDRAPKRGPGGTFMMVLAAGGAQGHHLPDFQWQAYLLAIGDRQGYLKARVKELTKRRGLLRFSWIQIADQLGLPLAALSPAGNLQESLARAARGPAGRSYQNGVASARMTGAGFMITIENRSPIAIKRQGQDRLDRAVAQRIRGFNIAVEKGVLDDLKFRAQRWRGIFVTAG